MGENFTVSIDISGENNRYNWYRKPRGTPEDVPGTLIDGADVSLYLIENINFDNMGIYYVEVENDELPGMIIRNRNQNIFAVTDITGTVFLNKTAGVVMDQGDVLLYEITEPGQPYDLAGEALLNGEGQYDFQEAVLGNYIVVARPGSSFIDEVLQTYYVSTNDWVFARTLELREAFPGVDIEMIPEPVPFDPALGDGTILGIVESDFPDVIDPEAGLREDAQKKSTTGWLFIAEIPGKEPWCCRTAWYWWLTLRLTKMENSHLRMFHRVPITSTFRYREYPWILRTCSNS